LKIEIINTGSEIMLGRILNTHQQWLSRQLADLGYIVTRQVSVADTGEDIESAVRDGLSRAELVITTGGLGPTSDDLTRQQIAALVGAELIEDPEALRRIERFFASRNRPMPGNTRVQALVPAGAQVIQNEHGTAPGLVLEVSGFAADGSKRCLVMLPGPPRELRPMFKNQIAPLLRQRFPLNAAYVCHTYRTTGLGESQVEELIATPLEPLLKAGLIVGYCAQIGQVDVRLEARGPDAAQLVESGGQVIQQALPKYIFGVADERLEDVVVRSLIERRQTLACAESCTGGFLAHRVTNVPGASAAFLGGVVSYSNQAKERLLGVRPETLAEHGAVSEAVAKEMAAGARAQFNADYALAVTGIAGPDGGTAAKPVGTVFIALATTEKATVLKRSYPYDRETFKYVTSQQALELLRRRLNRSVSESGEE